MTFSNETAFGGLAIEPFNDTFPFDPTKTMPRIAVEYDDDPEEWTKKFRALLELPVAAHLRGLSVGAWGAPYENDSTDIALAVAAAAPRLPNLNTLVFGDLSMEEAEVSWIENSELGPMVNAYPNLTALLVRGGNHLGLTGLRLPQLSTLVVQTGGLDSSVVQQLLDAELPSLTHLELYTGAEDYGATVTMADLAPIISGHAFPKLTYLGLKNSELQDDIAIAMCESPLLDRLQVLDLSLGILTDAGGKALLNEPRVRNLGFLNLEHHWMTDAVAVRFRDLGISVDLSDPMHGMDVDDFRYVAIGE
ncbi:STM4015 family protein [Ammonicoccus fulvus]|uniref:STM4015 family protein n=1 Tax=Ammonicoccus fulvus TaxID=3138240 RepID=A0ABZ3FUG2_9ACTN